MRKILLLIVLTMPLLLSARTLEEKWILCSNVNCQILDSYYEDGVSFTWDGEILNNKGGASDKGAYTARRKNSVLCYGALMGEEDALLVLFLQFCSYER